MEKAEAVTVESPGRQKDELNEVQKEVTALEEEIGKLKVSIASWSENIVVGFSSALQSESNHSECAGLKIGNLTRYRFDFFNQNEAVAQEAMISRLEKELKELEEAKEQIAAKHKEDLENIKNEMSRQHDEKLQHYSQLLHAKELEVILLRQIYLSRSYMFQFDEKFLVFVTVRS